VFPFVLASLSRPSSSQRQRSSPWYQWFWPTQGAFRTRSDIPADADRRRRLIVRLEKCPGRGARTPHCERPQRFVRGCPLSGEAPGRSAGASGDYRPPQITIRSSIDNSLPAVA
jgi:hypothetical protein